MAVQTVRRSQWWRWIPQLVAVAALAWLFVHLGLFRLWLANAALAMLLVIAYRYIVVRTVTARHLAGMKLVRQYDYHGAAEQFSKALEFFTRWPVLDKWRSVLLLDPGRFGYRELAMMNLGFCYSQMHEWDKAIACYETCANLHPDNAMVQAALKASLVLKAKSRKEAE